MQIVLRAIGRKHTCAWGVWGTCCLYLHAISPRPNVGVCLYTCNVKFWPGIQSPSPSAPTYGRKWSFFLRKAIRLAPKKRGRIERGIRQDKARLQKFRRASLSGWVSYLIMICIEPSGIGAPHTRPGYALYQWSPVQESKLAIMADRI